MINKSLSNCIARQFGFETYCEIMDMYNNNIISDANFQKKFKGYYRIRRSKEWCDKFFLLMGRKDICYKSIILALNEIEPYYIEASFASKLLATRFPDLPVIDSKVLGNLGLSIKPKDIKSAEEVYCKVIRRYHRFKKSAEFENVKKLFDDLFPDYAKKFSDTKKLDFFLWSMTKEELEEIGLFGELIDE